MSMQSLLQGARSRPKRYRKHCPIDDCTSTPLKVSQHLLQYHHILNAELRAKLSKSAERVCTKPQHDVNYCIL